MSVESGRVEAVVVPQRLERLSVREQKLDRADIAVVRAPLEKRYAVFVHRSRRVARGDVIEHQVRASVCDSIEYVFAHIARFQEPAVFSNPSYCLSFSPAIQFMAG